MAAHVEHEKRKKAILRRAVSVFASEGYAGTTFQKIADACKISRTILYLSYPNKQAIFRGAIRTVIDGIARDLEQVAVSSQSVPERIEAAMNRILDDLSANIDLMRAIHDYLVYIARKTGRGEPGFRFRAQTAMGRRGLRRLVADGIAAGQIHPDCDPTAIEGLLFAILETAGLRLALLGDSSMADLRVSVRELVRRIAWEAPGASVQ